MDGLGKIPPQAIDVEKAVLGGILKSQNCFVLVSEIITPETFYKHEHQKIYEAILRLSEVNRAIDIMTLVDELGKSGDVQMVGGPLYIAQLTNDSSSEFNIEDHAKILTERYMSRCVIDFGSDIIKKAYKGTDDIFDLNDLMADRVYEIQNLGKSKKEITNKDLIHEIIKDMESAKDSQGITGVRTGFKQQDKLTGGFQPGNLIILAARPGMGKTALMLCWALNMVTLFDEMVLIFSLEMTAKELMKRLISVYTGIEVRKISRGEFVDADWGMFNSRIESLLNDKLIIVDDVREIRAIRNRTKKERMKGDIGCIIIDYLQIAEGKGQSREQEISYISRQSKHLAKEINCPVIALSQLSRDVEKRGGDKRPKLSDLRESGAIEQDADMVGFLYRPGYYKLDEEYPGESYLCWEKNRHGGVIDIKMVFKHEQTKFIDYEVDGGLPF